MADVTVTTDDLEALAAKLQGIDGLTGKDRDALAAVFSLAGEALAGEVEGFGFGIGNAGPSVSLNFTMPGDEGPEERILIGLLKNPGTFSMRKAGGGQVEY